MFLLERDQDPAFMPLYAEIVKVDSVIARPAEELAALSRGLWQRHMKRRPEYNPVRRFQARFERDLDLMRNNGISYYHAWAFATTRQLGAAAELAAANLKWLTRHTGLEAADAIEALDRLSAGSKSFILKGARAASSAKPFDAAATFDEMASSWQTGMKSLEVIFFD